MPADSGLAVVVYVVDLGKERDGTRAKDRAVDIVPGRIAGVLVPFGEEERTWTDDQEVHELQEELVLNDARHDICKAVGDKVGSERRDVGFGGPLAEAYPIVRTAAAVESRREEEARIYVRNRPRADVWVVEEIEQDIADTERVVRKGEGHVQGLAREPGVV